MEQDAEQSRKWVELFPGPRGGRWAKKGRACLPPGMGRRGRNSGKDERK